MEYGKQEMVITLEKLKYCQKVVATIPNASTIINLLAPDTNNPNYKTIKLNMMRYKHLLKVRRNWYKSIKKIYCPVLKQDVFFTSKGFHHLIYPGGKMRPIKEQMYKLGLLPLAIPVIKNAKKIYKYEKSFIENLGKEVGFWILKETVGQQKTLTKVILRKVGTGKIIFFSIMKINGKKKKIWHRIKKTIREKR